MTLPTEFSEVEARLRELEDAMPLADSARLFYTLTIAGVLELRTSIDAVRTELARALDGMVLMPEEDAQRTPRLPQ